MTDVTMVRIAGVDYPLRGRADSQTVRAAMRAAGINQASLYRNGEWLEADLILLRDGGLETREAREWPKEITGGLDNDHTTRGLVSAWPV